MPNEERHAIIIIINGLNKMKGNATTGAVVELIDNVTSADNIVGVSSIEQEVLHELLDTTEDFIVEGITIAEDEDNGAIAATIDSLNSQFAEAL